MKTGKIFFVLALLTASIACNRDPNAAKLKYVESGNRYFNNGKYKQASIMYRKALSKDLKYGEAYYRLGLSELQLKNPPAALRSLRRAVELLPDNEDAHAKLGDLFFAAYLRDPRRPGRLLTDIRDLADDKKGLLKRNPKSYHGLRLMGFVALAERDLQTAIERFKKASEIKPFQADVAIAYAQALSANKQWEEAEKLALTFIEKQPASSAMYDVLYTEYGKRGRLAEAEAILRKKAENNPKDVRFLLHLAAHYRGVNKPEEVTQTLNRILSNQADFPTGHKQVGDFYFRVKDYANAIKHYEAGLGAAGDDKLKNEYKRRIVVVYVAQNRKKEARELVEYVLSSNPKDSDALAMRASLSLQGGSREQIQTAINDLTAVLSQQPGNAVLRYEIGRAHLAKREEEQARGQFQEAIKLRPDYIAPKVALARIYLARGEYAKALQSSGEVLAIDPNNLQAKLIRSSALMGSGELRQARGELEALSKTRTDSTDAQFQLAMLNFAERRHKDAEDIFKKLHDANPGDSRGLMGMVESHMAQGRQDQAIAMLRNAVEKSPERADYRLALANIAIRAAKHDLAIQEYSHLLGKNPRSSDLNLRLGEAYRLSGDTANALNYYRKAKELSPNDPIPSTQLALLLDTTGHHAEARLIYEEVLKMDPDNAVVLNNLAFAMAESGSDLDQALTLVQRAKQKRPTNPDISDTLGWIYIKKNLSDNAISIFRELTAKHGTSPTYHYHLGMALLQKGDKPQAKKALETALRNKPSKEEEGKIKELMARIG